MPIYRDRTNFRHTVPWQEVYKRIRGVLDAAFKREDGTLPFFDWGHVCGQCYLISDEKYTRRAVALLEETFYNVDDDPETLAKLDEIERLRKSVMRLERKVVNGID
jgi:hypothetical protein